MRNKSLYIDGQWVDGSGDEFFGFNPATGDCIWQGATATVNDIQLAVQAAKEAFPDWASQKIVDRKSFIQDFALILEENKEEYARVISEDTGKPYWESLTEVTAMVNKIRISFAAYEERCAVIDKEIPGSRRYTRFKAHGAVGVFGPFNLPGHLPNGHIVPALLAGNTIVFKPSEQTPLSAQKYVEYWERTKLPHGVLNCVQGARETGVALSAHPDLKGLFFTGSAAVGKAIHQACGGHPDKILALEMGGNNPLIVEEIDDIKAAVYATIQSAFITSGQRCVCARRLIVTDTRWTKEFLNALVEATEKIRIGPHTDSPEPFMGPLISERAAQSVLDWQKNYEDNGADVLLRAQKSDKGDAFITPGIIDTTRIKREDAEVFGPLLQVIRVNSLDEAIKEANNTVYGLSAGIVTNIKESYLKFFNESRAGVVNWNRPITGASSEAPFGGVGESGNYRPSAYFAADYCSFPVASIESPLCELPEKLASGITL